MASKKYDQGKLKWTLIPWDALEQVTRVLNFGANKYGEHNWQGLEDFEERYSDALVRHFYARMRGEKVDPESKILHSAHVAVNALFLVWKDLRHDVDSNP